jgi:hypothetical protein
MVAGVGGMVGHFDVASANLVGISLASEAEGYFLLSEPAKHISATSSFDAQRRSLSLVTGRCRMNL